MRERATKAFLWLAVLAAGPLVGAKLFDLIVLAGAWSADPPRSLALLPYGAAWPVDTGAFFIPSSAALFIASLGALLFGWRTPWSYRWLLCIPALGIFAMLVLTVLVFWPMNAALWGHASGAPGQTLSDAEAASMASRWVQLDWIRIAGGTAAFVAALRALTLPWPAQLALKDSVPVRILLAIALLGVASFIVWFVSNI
ncbi:MAG TPA: DUF1772 domain-containing protein [Parvularcula sp.]|nr:DUF1772 domain-containing protein [Parvularcula sp.]